MDHPPSGIVNIVARVNLDCELDLKRIALGARNAKYNPRRYAAAVIMRLKAPKATCLIFTSGKLVVTGAKSEEKSRLAAQLVGRIVRKIGYSVTYFKIHNMVGSSRDLRLAFVN